MLTFVGEDTNDRGVLVDVLDGIFDLEDSSFGVEDGGLSVVFRGLNN